MNKLITLLDILGKQKEKKNFKMRYHSDTLSGEFTHYGIKLQRRFKNKLQNELHYSTETKYINYKDYEDRNYHYWYQSEHSDKWYTILQNWLEQEYGYEIRELIEECVYIFNDVDYLVERIDDIIVMGSYESCLAACDVNMKWKLYMTYKWSCEFEIGNQKFSWSVDNPDIKNCPPDIKHKLNDILEKVYLAIYGEVEDNVILV